MRLAHAAIWVSDLDRAIAFYESIGLERTGSFELDGVANVHVGRPRAPADAVHGAAAADDDASGGRETATGVDDDATAAGDDVLQLRHDPDRTTPIAPSRADVDHVALGVDDVDGTFEAAVDAGAAVLARPHPVPAADSYAAFVEDPDGYTLEFVEPLD